MHRAQRVQYPQRRAHVLRHPSGLRPREHAALQQECQGVALHIFLQHGHLSVLLRHLLDAGQIRAVHRQQLAVHLGAAGEATEYVAFAGAAVPQQRHAAPRTPLQQPHLLKICLHIPQKSVVHRNFPLSR